MSKYVIFTCSCRGQQHSSAVREGANVRSAEEREHRGAVEQVSRVWVQRRGSRQHRQSGEKEGPRAAEGEGRALVLQNVTVEWTPKGCEKDFLNA